MEDICLIIRIGNFGTTDAIQEHQAIIHRKGYAWGGWWAQAHEFLPLNRNIIDRLKVTSQKKEIQAFFLNSETDQLYSVQIANLEYSLDNKKIDSPEKTSTPKYYRNFPLLLWFKLTYISQPIEERKIREYSYCDYNDECITDNNHNFDVYNNKIISSIKELSLQDRSLFFVRRRIQEDREYKVSTIFTKAYKENIATTYKQMNGNSILLLSDLHFSDLPDKHAFRNSISEGLSKKTLSQAVFEAIKNKYNPEKVNDITAAIIAGDLTYCGSSTEFYKMKEFIIGLYKQYAMDMDQIIVVPGNHDINFRVKKGNQEIAYADLAAKRNYMDLYEELYKITPNDYLAIGKKIMLKNQLPIDIVGLNSNCLQQVERHFQGMGFVGNEQINMIEREMNWNKDSYSYKILVLHHNIHPVEYIEKPEFDYAYSTCLDSGLIASFITRNKINLVIHGHKHQEQFIEIGYKTKDCQEGELYHYNVLGLGSAGSTELGHGIVNSIALLDFNEYNSVSINVFQVSNGNNDNPRELFKHKIKIY